MKSRLLSIILPLALLLLASLACGGSGSATPAASGAKSQAAAEVATPASGGLGLDRAAWDAAHVRSGAQAGFEDYDKGAYSVLFRDDKLSQIERNYKDSPPSLAQRREEAAKLIPVDATLIRTYSPKDMPELTIDLHVSAWLASRFPSGPWPNAEPGQFILIHGPGRTVIALGNDQEDPAPAATTKASAAPAGGALVPAGAATPPAKAATKGAIAAKDANLRAGPATTFKVVGGVKAGDPLQIVGKNKAGNWYKLAGGQWIADFLVTNPPDVPVVAEPVSSAPAPTNVPAAAPAVAVPASRSGTVGGTNPGAFTCAGGCAVAPDPSCAIKGNVNSKGEKIYHTPDGAFYDRTDIKPEEGDRWFCSSAEAEAAGFRASER
jgi:hypothetical protein